MYIIIIICLIIFINIYEIMFIIKKQGVLIINIDILNLFDKNYYYSDNR
ncbi:MAG: hypothetical protein K0S34_565 [Bacillales bacterium]|jgi:hypothetical protein|nr:hypothetical protein [Bacillales bacterium]